MWKFVKTGTEGDCQIFGVNIFDYKWKNTGQKVEVSDPIYGQKHLLCIYDANIGDKTVIFASGEFSNSVYGFYVKE